MSGVRAASPLRQSDPPPAERRPRPHIYSVETVGLLIIALLILVLTLIRYWHNINWSAR
jgi:hypothetical protein